uniref:Uncharacterized protein n=1 Tax=Chromera velia CCMP2878 TaxID=1169474 RepID=A0A0G4FFY1_9ALVE|eukprot:Cvel_3294.t1-p1 / transcript=Cvel_3294.t1 / gene=Cvel_3294 / organism=Chromera_velia_CCMP2878 / gene_product=hypothetical protein / transcript_product=hypothetical protein / location=Cvel_scaffold130:13661-37878(-) / protein_length=419 / sequence_SO=supercontig / SO=protein_coding / is_pseudo=false
MEEIDPSIQDEVGAANRILGWGTKLLWKNYVFYHELQRHIRNPCRRMLRNVGLVLKKVKKEKQRIKLRPLEEKGRKVHVYTDCRRKEKTKMVKKRVVAFWGDETWSHKEKNEWNPIFYKTEKEIMPGPLPKSEDSSHVGELISLKFGAKEIWRVLYLIDELTEAFPKVIVYIDSAALHVYLRVLPPPLAPWRRLPDPQLAHVWTWRRGGLTPLAQGSEVRTSEPWGGGDVRPNSRSLTQNSQGSFDFFWESALSGFWSLEETGVAGTSSVGMKWSLQVTVLEAPGSTLRVLPPPLAPWRRLPDPQLAHVWTWRRGGLTPLAQGSEVRTSEPWGGGDVRPNSRSLTQNSQGSFDFFWESALSGFWSLEETGVAGTSSVGMKWSLQVTVLEAPGSTLRLLSGTISVSSQNKLVLFFIVNDD